MLNLISEKLKLKPLLEKNFEEIKNDPKSLARIRNLSRLAHDFNKQYDGNITVYDMIENTLITDKDERVEKAVKLAKEQGIMLDEKDAELIFYKGSNADLPKGYENKLSGARPVLVLLSKSGLNFTYWKNTPKPINDFVYNTKNRIPQMGDFKVAFNILIADLLGKRSYKYNSKDIEVAFN